MMFSARLTRAVHRMWRRKGLGSGVLLPLSGLAGLLIAWRHRRAHSRPERIWHAPVPVVVVGNIYVGGTGKTPIVIRLAELLRERGWQPGVISRGYGGRAHPQPRTGRGALDPVLFGDEPALIARRARVPVAVHRARPLAARALLAAFPEVDVLIADDGLQHWALGRDAELLVQDGRGIGNGRLLPAGPLREPASRIETVDLLITHQSSPDTAPPVTGVGRKPANVSMQLVPVRVRCLASGQEQGWAAWLDAHRGANVDAMAGIGEPARFFSMLRAAGLRVIESRALPDHAAFSPRHLDGMNSPLILMTEKDAIKLPRPVDDARLHAIEVQAEFSDLKWVDALETRLRTSANRRTIEAHTG